jgi:D-aspartate ligase
LQINPSGSHVVPVIITSNNNTNNLGVIRNLGRHHIPIILLDPKLPSMVQHSRYVSRKLAAPNLRESEDQFIQFLLDLSRKLDEKCMLIATNDPEIIVLSKYKEDLEKYYYLPIPSFEVVQKLVNKKNFYQFLDQISIPHPKTLYPKDVSDLRAMGREQKFPFIIKPVYPHTFLAAFGIKCFVIESPQAFDRAIAKLEGNPMEVMVQDIIAGGEIYMLYTYFDKKGEPATICGYDKLRQYPPNFGSGSLCRTSWRTEPINCAIQVLTALKYNGMAEPEFKMDPRDGIYKLLEINARTTTQSILPSACGINTEYAAYMDVTGRPIAHSVRPPNGILWIDEIGDTLSCIRQIRQGTLHIREVLKSLKGKRIYAAAAWDDPIPFLVSLYYFFRLRLKQLLAVGRPAT